MVNRPRQRLRPSAWRESWFVAPALVLTLAVFLVPTLIAIYYSFFRWKPGISSSFVGLTNYQALWSDDMFLEALRNEGIYLLGVPLWTLTPLVLALFLYERVPFAGVFRAIYFLPAVIPLAISALIFKTVLAPQGAVNELLRNAGMDGLARNWIDDPSLIKPTIITMALWSSVGLGTLIYGAALSAVPTELFDAARLDGAGWWARLRYIVWPELRPTVLAFGLLQIVTVFVYFFGTIVVLTYGGPGYSSATLDFDVYLRSLQYFLYGQGAAESVTMLALLAITVAAAYGLLALLRPLLRNVDMPAGHRRARVVRKRRIRRHRGDRSWLKFAVCCLVSVPFLYPFFYLAVTAFKTEADFNENRTGWPRAWSIDAFQTSWEVGDLGHALLNSALAVGIGVVITVLVSTTAGYWFFRHRSRGPSSLFLVIGLFFAVPVVTWLVPLYITFSRVGLADNLWALGVVYAATQIPLGIGIMVTYMRQGIPDEVIEAASVDGAGAARTFWSVVFPLARPAIGTVIALSFVFLWGDNIIALILLQDPSKFTSVVAATAVVAKANPALRQVAAAGLINLVPVMVVFLLAQRAITRGFTAGVGR